MKIQIHFYIIFKIFKIRTGKYNTSVILSFHISSEDGGEASWDFNLG